MKLHFMASLRLCALKVYVSTLFWGMRDPNKLFPKLFSTKFLFIDDYPKGPVIKRRSGFFKYFSE